MMQQHKLRLTIAQNLTNGAKRPDEHIALERWSRNKWRTITERHTARVLCTTRGSELLGDARRRASSVLDYSVRRAGECQKAR